jgi:hypothetical protein
MWRGFVWIKKHVLMVGGMIIEFEFPVDLSTSLGL